MQGLLSFHPRLWADHGLKWEWAKWTGQGVSVREQVCQVGLSRSPYASPRTASTFPQCLPHLLIIASLLSVSVPLGTAIHLPSSQQSSNTSIHMQVPRGEPPPASRSFHQGQSRGREDGMGTLCPRDPALRWLGEKREVITPKLRRWCCGQMGPARGPSSWGPHERCHFT